MNLSPHPVIIPLLNPNEPEAVLAGVYVTEGQQVSDGDPLCMLETTKSTAELAAEVPGYVAGLRLSRGQVVSAGELFCFLAPSPDWVPPEPEALSPETAENPQQPAGLRISQPALALARQHHLDLAYLPIGPLVTEGMVRALIEKAARLDFSPPQTDFDPSAIVIYGGGGHGKSLIDLLRMLGSYRIVGILDDRLPVGETLLNVPILGGSEALPELRAGGVRLAVNAVGGIGNIAVRVKVFRKLEEAGFVCPTVLHPAAFIEPSAQLSPGVQVFPQAYIGSEARVGYGTIVNSGAIISHDCNLGDYVNISPGAILAGAVQIGSGTLVGMGVTINLEVKVGPGARIGNGATVKSDIPDRGVVRAGAVWPE
jgi:sugar O-acyltransferase (sialic acid O-acetyltransferase NeuD family)